MNQSQRMKYPLRAHLLAMVAALSAIVIATAAWIVNLRMGPPLDGFVAGPMVIMVPFALLALVGLWFALRSGIWIRWTALIVLIASLAYAFAVIAVLCGPVECFTPNNHNRLMGWYIVGGVGLAALVHHVALVSASGVKSHAE